MKSSDRLLVATALATFCWVVLRAATQAITIDEATTYVVFVMHPEPLQWLGSTNNHVLNTALMRLSTLVFGLSAFKARIPAMIGAALYITACVRFCRRMDGESWLRWLALTCLIGGPFVLDYLVAARGYGLALGFLMMLMLCDPRRLRGCAWASAFGGLCLASNFSFAFAAIAAGTIMFIRSLRESKLPIVKLLPAYLLPGLAITWFISIPSILNFPRQELWYGAHSLRETFASIVESQSYSIHPQALGPAQPYLFAALASVSIAWLASNARRLPSLTVQFGATFLLALALHAIAFHAAGLLYPLDRTALFLVPLGLGTIFSAAAIPKTPLLRFAQVAVLVLLALNDILCLRYAYFEEWWWNRDTDRIYATVTCLHDRDHVNHVAAGWPYVGTLLFYRETAQRDTFDPVVEESVALPNTEVFVVSPVMNPTAIPSRHLIALWTSKDSPTQIAVPPEQLERLKGSTCLTQ